MWFFTLLLGGAIAFNPRVIPTGPRLRTNSIISSAKPQIDSHKVPTTKKPSLGLTTVAALSSVVLLHPDLAIAYDNAWAGPTRAICDPLLLVGQTVMLFRVIISWYPEINLNKLPYNIITWPTEPFLRPTRKVIPPAFGVDISPIVWIAILSFFREIFFGQQGVFNML